jgi:hypothetical protein
MLIKDFLIDLDINSSRINNTDIELVQSDIGTYSFTFTIYDGLTVQDLSGVDHCYIYFSRSDDTVIQDINITISATPTSGVINYVFTNNSALSIPGDCYAEIKFYDGDSSEIITSSRFKFYVREAIDDTVAVQSSTQYPELQTYITELQAIEDDLNEKIETDYYRGATGLQGNPGTPGANGTNGTNGVDGTNGESLFTWIKYADTPTTGMSDSPTGKEYLGITYNKETATPSVDYSDYSWILTKGEQGIQGIQGIQAPVIDNLTSASPTEALSANQGKILNDGKVNNSGDTMEGVLEAQSNASYTTKQVRNIILSTLDADVGSMGNGDIWIKYIV